MGIWNNIFIIICNRTLSGVNQIHPFIHSCLCSNVFTSNYPSSCLFFCAGNSASEKNANDNGRLMKSKEAFVKLFNVQNEWIYFNRHFLSIFPFFWFCLVSDARPTTAKFKKAKYID